MRHIEKSGVPTEQMVNNKGAELSSGAAWSKPKEPKSKQSKNYQSDYQG